MAQWWHTVRSMSQPEPEHEHKIEVTVEGDGEHYVWNDDHSGLIKKDGPIDTSRPFFLSPDDIDADDPDRAGGASVDWSGWETVGYTEGGNAFGPDGAPVALTPPDMGSVRAIMEGGTLHVESHIDPATVTEHLDPVTFTTGPRSKTIEVGPEVAENLLNAMISNDPCPVCGQDDGRHDLARHIDAGTLNTRPEEPK